MKRLFYLMIGCGFTFFVNGQNPGELDEAFNLGNDLYCGYSILPLPNGKLLVAGSYIPNEGTKKHGIIRVNNDGTLDPSFNIEGSGTYSPIYHDGVFDILVQPDKKILIVGYFDFYNGVRRSKIARLNTNGSLDNTFNGPDYNGWGFHSAALQDDGKILINRQRLNTDGSVDKTFNVLGVSGRIDAFSIQPDNKILAGGSFTVNNSSNNIVRLHSDGSIDSSFQTGLGFNNWVFSMALQTDGKILVGGGFSDYNGTPSNKIIRLNHDGSVDDNFNIGTGFSSNTLFGFIYSIVLQNDGKILIGGYFTSYNGQIYNNIIRLNQDGNVDLTFQTGIGFNNEVTAIALQSDGKILVGGFFDMYNGQSVPNLVRLHGDGSLDIDSIRKDDIKLYPNPASNHVVIESLPENSQVKIYDSLGKLIYCASSNELLRVDTSGFSAGIYLVRIISGTKKEEIRKFVVSK